MIVWLCISLLGNCSSEGEQPIKCVCMYECNSVCERGGGGAWERQREGGRGRGGKVRERERERQEKWCSVKRIILCRLMPSIAKPHLCVCKLSYASAIVAILTIIIMIMQFTIEIPREIGSLGRPWPVEVINRTYKHKIEDHNVNIFQYSMESHNIQKHYCMVVRMSTTPRRLLYLKRSSFMNIFVTLLQEIERPICSR